MLDKPKHVYDCKRFHPRIRPELKFTPTSHRKATLPPRSDLRPYCPPIYDQLDLGGCTGNALAALFAFLSKNTFPTAKEWTPSRLFIYYNERAIEGTTDEDSGATISDGVDVLTTDGVPPEAAWTYDIAKYAVKPPEIVYGQATQNKLLIPEHIDNTDLIALKSCIAAGYPFAFGFTVFESMESEAVAKTGIVPMPKLGEPLLGGHAVLGVGYDNAYGRFLIRNSWGASWGMDGYFSLPYEYLTNPDLASDVWTARKVS